MLESYIINKECHILCSSLNPQNVHTVHMWHTGAEPHFHALDFCLLLFFLIRFPSQGKLVIGLGGPFGHPHLLWGVLPACFAALRAAHQPGNATGLSARCQALWHDAGFCEGQAHPDTGNPGARSMHAIHQPQCATGFSQGAKLCMSGAGYCGGRADIDTGNPGARSVPAFPAARPAHTSARGASRLGLGACCGCAPDWSRQSRGKFCLNARMFVQSPCSGLCMSKGPQNVGLLMCWDMYSSPMFW